MAKEAIDPEALASFTRAAAHDLKSEICHAGRLARSLVFEPDSAEGRTGPDLLDRLDLLDDMVIALRNFAASHAFTPRPEFISFSDLIEATRDRLFYRLYSDRYGEPEPRTLSFEVIGDVMLEVDIEAAGRALGALIENAILHSGGQKLQISVEPISRRGVARLRFEDDGVGVQRELRDRMFEPFQKLVRPDGALRLGLGLPTCRNFVEAHGGVARFCDESDELGGAAIEIELPLGRTTDERAGAF